MRYRNGKYEIRLEDCHFGDINIKDKNGVFIVHPDSEACSYSLKYRSKLANKIRALSKITLTKEFKKWYDYRVLVATVLDGDVYDKPEQHSN